MFHHLYGKHPNAAADLTEGGWLGAKARDLVIQAAHWHILYPGSHVSQVTVWKLKKPKKKPECHRRAVFTTIPWDMSQPWLPSTQFTVFSACLLFPSSCSSLLLTCSINHQQAHRTLLMDSMTLVGNAVPHTSQSGRRRPVGCQVLWGLTSLSPLIPDTVPFTPFLIFFQVPSTL